MDGYIYMVERQWQRKVVKKYVCITTNQPDTNLNPNPNHTTQQHAIVSIRIEIVKFPMYPGKFVRYDVIAPFLHFFVVIVTLPAHVETELN